MVPKVSIVMAVCNGERYVREAVESILNQTFADFEFIIIDDGSTDSTWSILTAYAAQDSRVVLIRNQENIGLTRSLNKGLALAQGEYLARQDADDVSLPERLEWQVAFLDQHVKCSLVASHASEIDDNCNVVGYMTPPSGNSKLQADLMRWNFLPHGSVMFRSSAVRRMGGYDPTYQYAQDYDLWLRLAEVADLACLAHPLYQLRRHRQAVTVVSEAQQTQAGLRARRRALRRRYRYMIPIGLPPAIGDRHRRAQRLRWWASGALAAGLRSSGVILAMGAVFCEPASAETRLLVADLLSRLRRKVNRLRRARQSTR